MNKIVEEILAEAKRQSEEHPHDIHSTGKGMQSRYKWISRMLDRLARSDDGGPDVYRAGMIGLAAMCLRAVDSFDNGHRSIGYEETGPDSNSEPTGSGDGSDE